MNDLIPCLVCDIEIYDPSTGRTVCTEVPLDALSDDRRSYMLDEAIKRGFPLTTSNVAQGSLPQLLEPAAFPEAYIAQKRMEVLGVYKSPTGGLIQETQTSLMEKNLASAIGLQSAISFFEDVSPEVIFPQQLPAGRQTATRSEMSLPCVQARGSAFPASVQPLPPAPITPPQIITATPQVLQRPIQYERSAQDDGAKIEAHLIKDLKGQNIIRNYKGLIYTFDSNVGHYVAKTDKELRLLLNSLYGEYIESHGTVKMYRNLTDLIRTESSFLVSDEETDNPDFWVFQNCIVHLPDRTCHPNNGQFFVRSSLQCQYDPTAVCPQFSTFIQSAADGVPEVENLMWEVIGYILSPDWRGKKLFAFVGDGDCGKSLLANVLTDLIGIESVSSLSLFDVGSQFGLSDLIGKRLNVCMDLGSTPIANDVVAKIKMLTGGDQIRADIKYRDPVQFVNHAKLLLGSNFPIRAATPDKAFERRLVTIPFLHSIPPQQQDRLLREKFKSEFPGIVNKAIEVYLQLRSRGYSFTSVTYGNKGDVISTMTVDHNLVAEDTVSTMFESTGNPLDVVTSDAAYNAYMDFCYKNRIQSDSRIQFSKCLARIALEKKKIKHQGRSIQAFTGIKLKM